VSGNYFYPVLAGGNEIFTITYTYTDANGCVNSATADIEVIEHMVDAGEDVSIIEGSSTLLNGTGGIIFSWDPPEGLSCSGCQSPISTPTQTTTYLLTGYDANGCIGMDQVTVSLFPFDDITVFVPNTFTPNGDGINDYLFVYGSDIASISSLQIYDRWGNRVWFGQNLTPGMENQGWDGTMNGLGASEGTYAFIAEVHLTFGVAKIVQGNVTLIR
jgi:gliding motility-associated-like protein